MQTTTSTVESTSFVSVLRTDSGVASSSESRSEARTLDPSHLAYGATVSTQRVLDELTTRVTPYAASVEESAQPPRATRPSTSTM